MQPGTVCDERDDGMTESVGGLSDILQASRLQYNRTETAFEPALAASGEAAGGSEPCVIVRYSAADGTHSSKAAETTTMTMGLGLRRFETVLQLKLRN
jgi:hypothetical protein